METPQRIEPTRIDPPSEIISDLVAELFASSATLGQALHPRTAENLANLVRIVNTYYSGLIEGHNTRPRDIERALKGDLDRNREKRDLQTEAVAHVRVQAEIDRLVAEKKLPNPVATGFIRNLHRDFFEHSPENYLLIRAGNREFKMKPGEWRSTPLHDVEVGRHLPPSSDRIEDFMRYFESCYSRELGGGTTAKIIAVASAHHRFNYIHPFPDGNGRVSRLMSHAMAHAAGVGAHGLWSISRGLARGLESRGEYKQMMDRADSPRQGDLDGRGNLSRRALEEFVEWFLLVAIDQVQFMKTQFDLENLRQRLRRYAEQNESLEKTSIHLLEEALIRGQFERGEASRITGLAERTARRVLAATMKTGLLASETSHGAVSLRFTVDSLETLFPRLFLEV